MKYIEAATLNTKTLNYWTERPYGTAKQVAKMVEEGILEARKVLITYPTHRTAIEYIAAGKR